MISQSTLHNFYQQGKAVVSWDESQPDKNMQITCDPACPWLCTDSQTNTKWHGIKSSHPKAMVGGVKNTRV